MARKVPEIVMSCGTFPRVVAEPYRVIMPEWSSQFGTNDRFHVLPEGRIARVVSKYVKAAMTPTTRLYTWIIADAKACGLKEGERFDWWMLGWWVAVPIRILSRYAPVITLGSDVLYQ